MLLSSLSSFARGAAFLAAGCACASAQDLPRAWVSYRNVDGVDRDFADLKAHGVGLVSADTRTVEDAKRWLENARRHGMKIHISINGVTQHADVLKNHGLAGVNALMIGGVYRGKAIDRHLFEFEAKPQEIVVEPPVYNERFAYPKSNAGGTPAGHYYPDLPDPARAEVIVPLRAFDGRQHLKVIPAKLTAVPADTQMDGDTVTADMPASPETAQRKLFRLSFDLTGLGRAQLDKVGIAVYWPYHGSRAWYIFGRGTVSCAAASTREAVRKETRRTLGVWSEANGGKFPSDVIPAARFGDECFYITGHLFRHDTAVNYPLWDYSEPSIAAYRKRAGTLEYPRTWGYPEVYGADAYAWWLYSLHEQCAQLGGVVREEIAALAPGLKLFRNTTRSGVFSMNNDHDGSGPELLTRNLDLVHLDPYPVTAAAYSAVIPRDMSYYSGLARRYSKPLVPWMQAHTYGGPGGLQHVTSEQVDRMAEEQYRQGVDAVIWLGYGPVNTFPRVKPESWERAGAFHKRLIETPPPKPKARMAVLRGYRAWASAGQTVEGIRNPADWMLQQLLEVWAIQQGQAYDVFELPPAITAGERRELTQALARYAFVVSTEKWPGAWVLGEGSAGRTVNPKTAPEVQAEMAAGLRNRGWLK